jgi:hypothetical protein
MSEDATHFSAFKALVWFAEPAPTRESPTGGTAITFMTELDFKNLSDLILQTASSEWHETKNLKRLKFEVVTIKFSINETR